MNSSEKSTSTSEPNTEEGSKGHKLGQLVGDWWAEFVVYPILETVAQKLELFLDGKYVKRSCRSKKIVWDDTEGNRVDYDFVLELGGSETVIGTPVGFIECFWRRGARHAKDKARDDSGKLLPMRETYPTARFLALLASGDFTVPARELITSRDIELFFIPKNNVIEAFAKHGLVMDYPDKMKEESKRRLATEFEAKFTHETKLAVSETLREIVGENAITAFVLRVQSTLSALPQEIRFIRSAHSKPVVFDNIASATEFLKHPAFESEEGEETFRYEITYSDGKEFEREFKSVEELHDLHGQIAFLAQHVEAVNAKLFGSSKA